MTDTRWRKLAVTDDIWHWLWAWGREHQIKGYNQRVTAQAILEEWRRRENTVAAILKELEQEQDHG